MVRFVPLAVQPQAHPMVCQRRHLRRERPLSENTLAPMIQLRQDCASRSSVICGGLNSSETALIGGDILFSILSFGEKREILSTEVTTDLYHLCINFYHLRQGNVPPRAALFTTMCRDITRRHVFYISVSATSDERCSNRRKRCLRAIELR